MKQTVCGAGELGRGQMQLTQLGPIRIVVARANDGELHALAANCLHQGGPLEEGRIYRHTPHVENGSPYAGEGTRDILKCPWHGYEYDVRTGCVLFDRDRSLQKFAVREEDGNIVIELGAPAKQGSTSDS